MPAKNRLAQARAMCPPTAFFHTTSGGKMQTAALQKQKRTGPHMRPPEAQ
jgi:hypothetical protein